jgi:hypothetical protein
MIDRFGAESCAQAGSYVLLWLTAAINREYPVMHGRKAQSMQSWDIAIVEHAVPERAFPPHICASMLSTAPLAFHAPVLQNRQDSDLVTLSAAVRLSGGAEAEAPPG